MPITTAIIAPNNMRKATSAMGPISCTPILIHRKDELQIAPRRMKTIQCLVFKETPLHEMGVIKLRCIATLKYYAIVTPPISVTIPAGLIETIRLWRDLCKHNRVFRDQFLKYPGQFCVILHAHG